MLLIVAVNVMAVCPALNWNLALPKDAGLGPPVEVVGVVGGFSCALVRFATNNLTWLGVIPPAVRSASTYWSFVRLAGNFVRKSPRVTKSLKYASLLASSCASAPGAPTT